MDLKDRAAQQFGDQTEDEVRLAGHVKSKVEEIRASASRIAYEGIWMTNCAYTMGYDGVTWNTQSRTFQPINRASAYLKKNRIHVNKILPTLQNRLAKLCKNPPKYDVRPETNNVEDKDAARLAKQVLNSFWDKLELNNKRIPLYMWVQQCGHAYMKLCWDESLGKPMVDPLTEEMGYEGDLRAEVISPFEVYPNPQAKTWSDVEQSWMIHCKVRTLDYFKMRYPEKGDLVKEEDAWLLSIQYENRINTMNTRGPASGNQYLMKNSAIEMVKYEARSKDYPNGRMISVANGVLLEDKELPCGKIPFAKFDDIVVGGKYYSECIVTHLRSIQDQYNEIIRRRASWINKTLAGKYMAPRGGGLAQESMNDESGEIVYFTPVPSAPGGGVPMAINVPVIPAHAYKEEEALNAIINDISGISDVSRGELPSASIPAVGMQILVESDDSRISIITENHENSWAKYGHLILEYFKKYYIMPRKFKLAGRSMDYIVREIQGADIKENTDVFVIRGSTLPGSKVLQRQDILNLYNQGLLGDPADPKVREKVLGLLEFGDVAEAWQDYALDMNQIKRGMEEIEKGIPLEVSEFDNHAMWLQEVNRFRKSDKWNSLDLRIQTMFLLNMEQHLQFIMKLSGAVPPAQQMLPDEPGVGPSPEQPPPPPDALGAPPQPEPMI